MGFSVETPCVSVDTDIMERNIKRMAGVIRQYGVKLRPHVKTHKSVAIAKLQLEAGAAGITVAKVSEAEIMADHDIDDIFIAYPIIGENRIQRVLALNERLNKLIVGVDSLVGANALAKAAAESGQCVEVRMEVDTGLKRTGVPYEQAADLALEIVKLKGIRLTGIFTFRGLIYQGKATADFEKAGQEEGELMVALAEKLKEKGIEIEDVSVGSTPTAIPAAQIPGITEVRPGTYVFNDAYQLKAGTCCLADCAAKVLVTVVSTPAPDRAVIDGGCKTFATDIPPGKGPLFLEGFGKIVGDDCIVLERFSEEHGILTVKSEAKGLKVGDLLEIIPNHICPTINLHNRIYLTRNGQVVEEVPVNGRGMVY